VLADTAAHRRWQTPGADAQILRASVRSPRETRVVCPVKRYRLTCSHYTLSPIMSSQNLSAMYLWFPGVYPDSPQSSPASHAPVTVPAPMGFPACAIAAQSRLPTRFVEECTG